ncbi:MAG TPA: hypothetical protein VM121_01345 [Acidimicrobiales bacterium]|nr:hypothetical protein [Acidimicrobiales bacterium]
MPVVVVFFLGLGAFATLVSGLLEGMNLRTECSGMRAGPAQWVAAIVALSAGAAWLFTLYGLITFNWSKKVVVALIPLITVIGMTTATAAVGQWVSDRMGGPTESSSTCF